MKKSLLLIFFFGTVALGAMAQNPVTYNATEIKEGQKTPGVEMINGYPATQFYHNNVTVPPDVLASPEKHNRIAVALHNRMVAWERTNQRPINSIAKTEMEALLVRLNNEAKAEVEAAEKAVAPKQ